RERRVRAPLVRPPGWIRFNPAGALFSMARSKKDLDLYKLEVFYWVAELRSFSEAAQRLSLRQPTVSAHIQDLEKGIGGKLFYRIPGKVSLTPLGEMIALKASHLLAFKRETLAGVVEEVIEGKVEIGYVGFKPADPRLALEKIWKDEMVLAIPRGHPWARRSSIDLAMLGAERFISRETGSGTLDSFRELLSDRGQTADDLLHVAM